MSKTLFVVNPAASGGRGLETWERFCDSWPDEPDPNDVFMTDRPGQATEIVASAEDYDLVVAVGGDGTACETLSGLMAHPEPRPTLALVPAGTGNDVARTVRIPLDTESAIATIRDGQSRSFDVIRIDCHLDGHTVRTYSLLSCGVGFRPGDSVRPWMKRWLGPTGAYYLATILEVLTYQLPQMRVSWEEREYSGKTWLVIIGNAEYTSGGSMRTAPGARMDDGELDVTIVPSRSRPSLLFKLLPKAPSGDHVEDPSIQYFPARRIEVESDPPADLEIDGNPFGQTPATLTVCPRAVRIVCPSGSDTLGEVRARMWHDQAVRLGAAAPASAWLLITGRDWDIT